MIKDILIDNSIAKDFCKPIKQSYKELISWLMIEGVLIVTQRLICEYHSSTAHSPALTNIIAIMGHLNKQGRLTKYNKEKLDSFFIAEKIKKKLRSNHEDWPNIKAVLLSDRKFALSLDENFCFDINNYKGFTARAEKQPEDLPYN